MSEGPIWYAEPSDNRPWHCWYCIQDGRVRCWTYETPMWGPSGRFIDTLALRRAKLPRVMRVGETVPIDDDLLIDETL